MIRLLSHAEQLAAHLREELLKGRWSGEMPGAAKLEAELGVNHTTVSAALAMLEADGLLVPQGPRRPRRIVLPKGGAPPTLRVGILNYEPSPKLEPEVIDIFHHIAESGHTVCVAPKSIVELNTDLRRVRRMLSKMQVDAWVALSSPEEILRWFVGQPTPVIAWAGQIPPDLQFASVAPNYAPIWEQLVRRLVSLGHRRIVLLTRSGSQPGVLVAELEAAGIQTSAYNFPRWDSNTVPIRPLLNSLFALTPPTALIIDEPCQFLPVQHELAQRGLFAPEHLSLICVDYHASFQWIQPSVAHIRPNYGLSTRRIIRWLANVARGKEDRRRIYTKAEFVDGGTIGPAPKMLSEG